MSWIDALKRKTEVEDDLKKKEADDLELKSISDSAKKTDKLEADFTAFKDKAEKDSQRLNSFLDEQDKARRTAEATERAKKATETKENEDKELEELALVDPVKAANLIADKKMEPLIRAQINTQSVLLRKQIFDDDPNRYEFYTGDFKSEVDKLIDNLPFNQKTNPEAIKNCYAVAAFNKSQEIKEGKLKSRFAATSTTSTGTTTSEKKTPELSDAEKKAAAAFGIKEDDYSKMKEDMQYV